MITTAYYDDKVKISIRRCGREGENLREILAKILIKFNGEVGGHEFAAGGIIKQSQEDEFIKEVRMFFEPEVVVAENVKKEELRAKAKLAVESGDIGEVREKDKPEDFDMWGKKKVEGDAVNAEEKIEEKVEEVVEEKVEEIKKEVAEEVVEEKTEEKVEIVEQAVPLGQMQL